MRSTDKLTEEQIRSWVRMELFKGSMGIIEEQDSHSLYNVFVAPFVDVVQAAGLTGQDILNVSKLSFDMITTFSPSKMDAKRKEYRTRKAKISEKWKPLMDRSKQAMGEDAQILSFAINPAGFLGAKLAMRVPNDAKNINQYLHDSGWSNPLLKGIPGFSDNDWKEDNDGGSKVIKGIKDVAAELAKLFFIAHHAPSGPLLSEAEADHKKSGIQNFQKEFQVWLEQTGVADSLRDTARELVDNKKSQIKSILGEAVVKFELLSTLSAANDFDQFENALTKMSTSGIDVDRDSITALKTMMTDSAEKLSKNSDFRKALEAEKSSEDNDTGTNEMSDSKIYSAAKKVAFVNAKQELQKKLVEGNDSLRQAAIKELNYDLPKDKELKLFAHTSIGKELLSAIKSATDKINSYNIIS